ncbi:uncharacterized protein RJT20DRAFT_128017 [Scheffersomyces xylosifermentans]|uniref:uncharacterized protein n=1 Tax=Scheffersomyces xylosifermentans TaxID=1304137 RepID=UPI00315C7D91
MDSDIQQTNDADYQKYDDFSNSQDDAYIGQAQEETIIYQHTPSFSFYKSEAEKIHDAISQDSDISQSDKENSSHDQSPSFPFYESKTPKIQKIKYHGSSYTGRSKKLPQSIKKPRSQSPKYQSRQRSTKYPERTTNEETNLAVLLLVAFFIPPVAVILKRGCGNDACINLLLCIVTFGLLGIVHAIYIVLS